MKPVARRVRRERRRKRRAAGLPPFDCRVCGEPTGNEDLYCSQGCWWEAEGDGGPLTDTDDPGFFTP